MDFATTFSINQGRTCNVILNQNISLDFSLIPVISVAKLWGRIMPCRNIIRNIIMLLINIWNKLFESDFVFFLFLQSLSNNNINFLGYDITNPEDFNQFIVVQDDEKKFLCGICKSFAHKSRQNVRNHLESKHFKGYFSYTCDICGKVCGTNNSMQTHKSMFHGSGAGGNQLK